MKERERHARISDLFAEACDLSAEERERWWTRQRCEDPSVLAGVRELLRQDELDFEPLDAGKLGAPEAEATVQLPAEIAGYRIDGKLGAGGMGVVYSARQVALGRDVALKVVRHHLGDAEGRRRFVEEARVLARLDHAGIAQVFDAGVDQIRDELPWIAMERVRGRDVATYVREEELAPAEIADLIARICDAVEHAHQRGIVHRDLKHSNVMVDAEGEPKVLDFGIARWLDDEEGAHEATQSGRILGTLAYMSPEQAAGSRQRIGLPTDVYALGVMLYEALTRKSPIPIERLPLSEALTRIRRDRPIAMAAHDPALSLSLRGDLEVIVQRCLEKEPEDRFPSAGALGAELRRSLRGEPLQSRPPSLGRQLRGLYRRHRSFVLAGSLASVALLVATAVSVSFGVREADARALAEEATRSAREDARIARIESRTTTNLLRFVTDTLGGVDPLHAEGRDPTLGEGLDRMAASLPTLEGRAEVQAQLRGFLGALLGGLGREAEGRDHLRAALNSLDDQATLSPWLLDLFERSAWLELRTGHFAEAEERIRRGIALAERFEERSVARDLHQSSILCRAVLEQGRFEEARELGRSALRRADAAQAARTARAATLLHDLAELEMRDERNEEAGRLAREALAIRRELFAGDHLLVAETLELLGGLAAEAERIPEGMKIAREVLRIREALLADQHPALAKARGNLGSLELQGGSLEHARELLLGARTVLAESYGEGHPELAMLDSKLAMVLDHLGQPERAGPAFERALQGLTAHREAYLSSWVMLVRRAGRFAYEQGDFEQADKRLSEAWASQVRVGPFDPYLRVVMLLQIGGARYEIKRTQAALQPLEQALAEADALQGEPAGDGRRLSAILQARLDLAAVLQALGRTSEALLQNAPAVQILAAEGPELHPILLRTLRLRAEWLEELDRDEDAAAVRQRMASLAGGG